MPKVSVILPTYNRAAYISAAIDSALGQTYQDFELIVADDGSTDGTDAIVAAYGDRLTYLMLPHSGLPATTRNAGIRAATGQYIAFLDSDDLFVPDRLERHITLLEAQPGLAWVYSDTQYFDEGGVDGTLLCGRRPPQGQVYVPLLIDNFLGINSVTLRKNCLDAVGYFDETHALRAVEDYDLFLRMAEFYELGFAEGIASQERIHGGNISGSNRIPQHLGILQLLRASAQRHPALIRRHPTVWRERLSLLELAVARAYLRSLNLGQAARHLRLSLAADHNPRWLLYLATTPNPARRWLERTFPA
jgi:glycosyltransferase involved in cell wall biosynthesis